MALTEQDLRQRLATHGIHAESLTILLATEAETLYGLTVTGEEAIAQWRKLHSLIPDIEHYPVLLGTGTDTLQEAIALYEQGAEQEGYPRSAQQIIEKGLTMDAAEWFAEQAQEFPEGWEDDWEDEFPEADLAAFASAESGEGSDMAQDFTIPLDLQTRAPVDRLTLALVPTQLGWQVPAFLRFGGWNECPYPEVQVALMKRWYELYGADVVGITYDTVEMWVSRPPGDRDLALQLAREQYLYCSDIVDQGVQTLDRLAALLLNGSVWFFWWD